MKSIHIILTCCLSFSGINSSAQELDAVINKIQRIYTENVDSTHGIPSNIVNDSRFYSKYYETVRISVNGDRIAKLKKNYADQYNEQRKLIFKALLNDSVYAQIRHYYSLNTDTLINLDSSKISLDNFYFDQKEFYHFDYTGKQTSHKTFPGFENFNIDTIFYENGRIKSISNSNLYADTVMINYLDSNPNQIETLTYQEYGEFETSMQFYYWKNGQIKNTESSTWRFETDQLLEEYISYNKKGKLIKRTTTKSKTN